MSDSCNALDKVKGKLKICGEALGHKGKHRDGEHEWEDEVVHSSKRIFGSTGEEQ